MVNNRRPSRIIALGEFKKGWPILLTAFLGVGIGISSITYYTAGLFIEPLHAEFGWSHAEITGGMTVLTFGIALAAPLIGRLTDRIGAHNLGAASLCLMAAAYFALSRLPASLPAYYGILFFMAVTGAGSTPITFTRMINACFHEARGKALGITLAATGVVGFLAPLLLAPVIVAGGWRQGYFWIAVTIALLTPLIFFMPRLYSKPEMTSSGNSPVNDNKPVLTAEGMEFGEALRDGRFWFMTAAFVLSTLAISGLVINFIPILEAAGAAMAGAAKIASIIGISVMLGRLFTGVALDRFPAPYVGAVVLGVTASGCLALPVYGIGFAPFAGFLIGFAIGTEVDLLAFMAARNFGLKAYGRIFSLLYAFVLIASGTSPFLVGLFFDHFQSYTQFLLSAAICIFLSALLLLFIKPKEAARY